MITVIVIYLRQRNILKNSEKFALEFCVKIFSGVKCTVISVNYRYHCTIYTTDNLNILQYNMFKSSICYGTFHERVELYTSFSDLKIKKVRPMPRSKKLKFVMKAESEGTIITSTPVNQSDKNDVFDNILTEDNKKTQNPFEGFGQSIDEEFDELEAFRGKIDI